MQNWVHNLNRLSSQSIFCTLSILPATYVTGYGPFNKLQIYNTLEWPFLSHFTKFSAQVGYTSPNCECGLFSRGSLYWISRIHSWETCILLEPSFLYKEYLGIYIPVSLSPDATFSHDLPQCQFILEKLQFTYESERFFTTLQSAGKLIQRKTMSKSGVGPMLTVKLPYCIHTVLQKSLRTLAHIPIEPYS